LSLHFMIGNLKGSSGISEQKRMIKDRIGKNKCVSERD
jgi:hypothetical protein